MFFDVGLPAERPQRVVDLDEGELRRGIAPARSHRARLAGATDEGHKLLQHIQERLIRLDCMPNQAVGKFDAPTMLSLRDPSLLTDEHYLWYRPTMAALRTLNRLKTDDGCGWQKADGRGKLPACQR